MTRIGTLRRYLLHPGSVVCALLTLFLPYQICSSQQETSPEHPTTLFLFAWSGMSPEQVRTSRSEAIITDRPSFTDSSRPVGNGVTQIELGYTYSNDDSSPARSWSHSYPELAIRQGVFRDWLELRFSQSFSSQSSTHQDSVDDNYFELGTRIGLTPQFGWLPELSITPHLDFPTNNSTLRAQHALIGVVTSYSWNLCPSLSLAGGTQSLQKEGNEDQETYGMWGQSAIVTLALSSRFSVWAEGYAEFLTKRSETDTAYYSDAGVLYLVTSNLQLDARVGSRLQGKFGEDTFAGLGLSVRYL